MRNFALLLAICLITSGCNHNRRCPAQAAPGRPYQVKISEPLTPGPQPQDANSNFVWYDAKAIGVEGKGWSDTELYYDRLPAKSKGVVRDIIWTLSKNTAGMCVRFVTDSNTIAARWKLTSSKLAMPHMPSFGVSGLDLYLRDARGWHEIGVSKKLEFPFNEQVLTSGLCAGAGPHEFVIYLPLYNGVESLEIGILPAAKLAKAPPWPNGNKPIVFYGSSITQGACASRTGMPYTNMLQRRLERPIINLGFSGNAQLEPEMATLLCELDPAVYVLDPVPNCWPDLIKNRLGKLVTTLHDAYPQTPIIICETICNPQAAFFPPVQDKMTALNNATRETFERLRAKGIKNIYYISRDEYIGTDGEAFVDFIHPTDLGFAHMADALEPVIRKALARQQ